MARGPTVTRESGGFKAKSSAAANAPRRAGREAPLQPHDQNTRETVARMQISPYFPSHEHKYVTFPWLPSRRCLYTHVLSRCANMRLCTFLASLSMLFQGSQNAHLAFIQPILFYTCYLPATFLGSQDKMVSKKDTVPTK